MNDEFLEDFWVNASEEFNQRLRELELLKRQQKQDFLSAVYKTIPSDIDIKLSRHYQNIILNNGLFNYSYRAFDPSYSPEEIAIYKQDDYSYKTSEHIFPKIGNIGLISLSEKSTQQKQTKDFLINLNNLIEQDIHGFMDKLFIESFALPVFHKTYKQIRDKTKLNMDEKYIPVSNIMYCYNQNRTGFNNKFCCPFHQEKTPSFRYSFTKKKFYCFGCGYNMNIFGLTAIVLGVSVIEAIYILCKMYNVQPDVFRYPKMKYPLSIWKHML